MSLAGDDQEFVDLVFPGANLLIHRTELLLERSDPLWKLYYQDIPVLLSISVAGCPRLGPVLFGVQDMPLRLPVLVA